MDKIKRASQDPEGMYRHTFVKIIQIAKREKADRRFMHAKKFLADLHAI